ncbi:hypothetical protein DFH06DRAFT_1479482 [Mycena polygramma]|nr:hypothetical protein DFH06DRAFT_1479482 [Mycena polygramma]
MPSRPGEVCENCLLPKEKLRRCAACSFTRYCSERCQKAHWKAHKPACAANEHCMKVARSLGPEYSVRLPALWKWSADFAPHLGNAAASGLDMRNHPERIAAAMLVIYVDFLGVAAKTPHTHDIVNVEMLSVDDLLGDREIIPLPRQHILAAHTPTPGRLRVVLLDVHFPFPYAMDFIPPSVAELSSMGLNPPWFQELQRAVTRPGQQVRPREDIRVDIFTAVMTLMQKMVDVE